MISVVIVSHESAADLPGCLRAVVAEREGLEEPLEIVVVDNGSTDDSARLVRALVADARILELGENAGFARACNRGVAAARGELVLLLNPDARLEPGAIGALAAVLRAQPRAALASARLLSPDRVREPVWSPDIGVAGEAVRKLLARLPGRWGLRYAAEAVVRAILPGWYSAACVMVRRDAWQEVGGFDERFFLYFEDADLGLRLRRAGWTALSPPAARAVHERSVGLRRAAVGCEPSPVELSYRRSQLLYYRLHRPRWEQKVLRFRLRRRYRSNPELSTRLGEEPPGIGPLRRAVWQRRLRAAAREVERAADGGALDEGVAGRLREQLRRVESDLAAGSD